MLKNKKKKMKSETKGKPPVFIIEKSGKAYFNNRKLCLVCKPNKIITSPKYPGYLWEFDYLESGKLNWFKRYVALVLVNKGNVRFVDITLDEFNNMGGEPIQLDGVEKIDASQIKKSYL